MNDARDVLRRVDLEDDVAFALLGVAHYAGKVHAQNLGMRALYRKFGFEAAHLTMEKRLEPGPQ